MSDTQGVSAAAIEYLYELICRDPDIGTGGIDPLDVSNHSDGFFRCDKYSVEDYEGQAIDRKVQLRYGGTVKRGSFGHYEDSHRIFAIFADIGYYEGAHPVETALAMADDEQAVMVVVGAESIRPQGVWGYTLESGGPPRKIGSGRLINTLVIHAQVAGSR